jgi:lysophospholipase L1-like esterase
MSQTFVFVGDSITDAGRSPSAPLGFGFVRLLQDRLPSDAHVNLVNSGVSGNRAIDLAARWSRDVMAHAPTLLTVMDGVNETLRRYDQNDPTSDASFEATIRGLLNETASQFGTEIILFEPFLVPIDDTQQTWREDLTPRIRVIRKVAREAGARLIRTDRLMTEASNRHPKGALVPDGIHPSPLGNEILAEAWMKSYIETI